MAVPAKRAIGFLRSGFAADRPPGTGPRGDQSPADEITSLSLFVAALSYSGRAFYLQLLITADRHRQRWNEDTSNQRARGIAADHEKATPVARKDPGPDEKKQIKGPARPDYRQPTLLVPIKRI
jgi:hypothetical protein